jgi:hypothetical protein
MKYTPKWAFLKHHCKVGLFTLKRVKNIKLYIMSEIRHLAMQSIDYQTIFGNSKSGVHTSLKKYPKDFISKFSLPVILPMLNCCASQARIDTKASPLKGKKSIFYE